MGAVRPRRRTPEPALPPEPAGPRPQSRVSNVCAASVGTADVSDPMDHPTHLPQFPPPAPGLAA